MGIDASVNATKSEPSDRVPRRTRRARHVGEAADDADAMYEGSERLRFPKIRERRSGNTSRRKVDEEFEVRSDMPPRNAVATKRETAPHDRATSRSERTNAQLGSC